MPSEKHLQGVDHRNPPKPYADAPVVVPIKHPAFTGGRPVAIHHLDPSKPVTPAVTEPAAKLPPAKQASTKANEANEAIPSK
jgi:hypothetical protein